MRTLLAGVVMCLLATPLALTHVRRPCPDCAGADLGRKAFARKPGYCRTPVAALQCPRCGDRGTVTALNGVRGSSLSPELAELIQAEKDPYGKQILLRIDRAVRQSGRDPAEVCGWEAPPLLPQGWARFEKSDGKDYVVAFFYPEARPGPARAGLILFDLQGRILDVLSIEGEVEEGYINGKFTEAGSSIPSVLTLQLRSWQPCEAWFYVEQGGRTSTLKVTPPARLLTRRIAVANDRFVMN